MSASDAVLAVRQAGPADAARIEVLYRQLVDNPAVYVSPARLQELAGDPQTLLLVCEVDGILRATALVSMCRDAMFGDQPFAIVENFVVASESRRSGLGEFLMRHVERVCAERACSKIMLLSAVGRPDAHRFYEKLGFHGDRKRGFVKYSREFCARA